MLQAHHPAIRITAAHALHQIDDPTGKNTLLAILNEPLSEEAALLALNALRQIGAIEQIPEPTRKSLTFS